MRILNLTQHAATADQIAAGVVDFPTEIHNQIRALITFDECPTEVDLFTRATEVARVILTHRPAGVSSAMIGGAPFFMPELEKALRALGITPLYAFSKREAIDGPDGKKVSVFRHAGWVEGIA